MMRKFIKTLAVILTLAITIISGCNTESNGAKIKVYMPDGAPALAMCNNLKNNQNFEYNVIGADKIKTVVTGNNPVADVCVLPINNASNLLSDKNDYYMLGVLTHGNFYFLSKNNEQITRENASLLIGKTVAVVQLASVAGLTLKAALNELEIPYNELANGANRAENKVNLLPINANQIGVEPADFYLAPSPVADVKASGKLNFVGSLHELIGCGFPQAVIVAKRSIVTSRNVELNMLIDNLKNANAFLETASIEEICALIEGNLESGLTPTFNKNNLTRLAIQRANINYVSIENCKENVNIFIDKLIGISENSVKKIPNSFYYGGNL